MPIPAGLSLTILLGADGRVSVNGPLHEKLVCFGLLEMARQAIQDYDPAQRVEPAAEMPRILRPFNGS